MGLTSTMEGQVEKTSEKLGREALCLLRPRGKKRESCCIFQQIYDRIFRLMVLRSQVQAVLQGDEAAVLLDRADDALRVEPHLEQKSEDHSRVPGQPSTICRRCINNL